LKLIQYNGVEFVIYEITGVSLNITKRGLFRTKDIRVILFKDIEINVRERVNKPHPDFITLTGIFLPLHIYFLWLGIERGIREYWVTPLILGIIALYFFLRYVFPKTEIHIATNEKLISLYERKPSKKTVAKFIKYLEDKIQPAVKI